ncbi:MAG TPA: hypothetical protein ENH27_03090 [Rhizobiales bacterium]|nr:hypothetical protein [Hyphomicrobiales bacterium]
MTEKITSWTSGIEGVANRIDYNTKRPHTSLDGLTPNEFATRSRADHNQNGLYLIGGGMKGGRSV